LPSLFQQRLEVVATNRVKPTLQHIVRGIEKESLRITSGGTLAQTPHPKCLGSALTNPHITTDYSEALLEFITPPCSDIDQLLGMLDNIHRFTYQCLDQQESLWTASMPCVLRSDNDIPVAEYGASNSGRMKSIYRVGLGHRYGRAMQTIAGIHYNFSMADSFWLAYQKALGNSDSLKQFKNQQYLGLIRNFRRYSWLLIYLFGASPALCKSFIGSQQHNLDNYDDNTLYSEGATALRMGDLGYQSSAQENLVISYNSLESYISSLEALLNRQHPAYQQMGIKDENGEWMQLSTTLLQIENEFYSSIRPKQIARSGEAPILALKDRGIEYIEVRALDVNPYLPLGIDEQQIRFLDAFLLYCLLQESPALSVDEYQQNQSNLAAVVTHGRTAGIELQQADKPRKMLDWAEEILQGIAPIAQLLDSDETVNAYTSALEAQRDKLGNSKLTPSGQIMMDMQAEDVPWFYFAMNKSQSHADYFLQRPLDAQDKTFFSQAAVESLQEQQRIEDSEDIDLEQYLEQYYHQYRSNTQSAT
jgi:glutamate--cysteine ligase